MKKHFTKLLCYLLVAVMIFHIVPASAIAQGLEQQEAVVESMPESQIEAEGNSYYRSETAKIIEEDISKRDEYYKEFVLNNGLRMAAIYPNAVHYKENGHWEEIDNTLQASGTSYVNTAGVWDVTFPQQLTQNNAVTIQKDGYTLSFYMAGELRSNTGNLETASLTAENVAGTLSIQNMQSSAAHVEMIDVGEITAKMEHPELFSHKSKSRLHYSNVYNGTNIVYDLNSNQVKESIIIQAYSAQLNGYRYTLNVGQMKPVLTDNGEIHLYDREMKNIIMVMPAPFLVDSAGEYCYDVDIDLTGSGSTYTLTYLLPKNWLCNSQRQWPVVLDPVVNAHTARTNIRDVSVYEQNGTSDNNSGVLDIGHNETYGVMRSFLKYDTLPALTSADIIVDAELCLFKPENGQFTNAIEVHEVLETWESEATTWEEKPEFNETVVDYARAKDADSDGIVDNDYYWNITDIVRGWYANGNTGLMLKAPKWVEETTSTSSYRTQFYSADFGEAVRPVLTITFRNNNGLESYWDYTASTAGRAGTGYVNDYTGNLVWIHDDIGYGGNRMPVSISHIYNANDKEQDTFGLGYGWRTNFNQTISKYEPPGTENILYYVWEDSDGTKHYFYKVSDNTYQDEDGLDLMLTLEGNGLACTIVDKSGSTFYFDTAGRLYKLENNQRTKSSIKITYTASDSKKISTIKDGIDRTYQFSYSGNYLSRISYTGTGTTELGYLTYAYTNGCLTGITYQDGKTVQYEYNADKLLTAAQDINGYRLEYTYHAITDALWQPYRVSSVSEHDGSAEGGILALEYGHNQTTFTDHNNNVLIKQFNNWGNTLSIQDGLGRAQFTSYSPVNTQADKGNQLSAASKLQNTVSNRLNESSFENNVYWWTINSNTTRSSSSDYSYLGAKSLKMTTSTANSGNGVYSYSFTIPVGKTRTFSAYVKTTSSSTAYLALAEGSTILAASETLSKNSDWTRLEVNYTNDTSAEKTIRAQLMSATVGTVYMDCIQVEFAETASRYNIIENGDFRFGTSNWIMSDYCDDDEKIVTESNTATPLLSANAFQIVGDPEHKLRIRQEVPVSGVKDDTYVLAGWAQGDGVPLTSYTDDKRTFTIRGTFLYTDGTTGEFNFDFNPDTDSDNNWQYAAGVMVAEKAYSGIKILVLYDFNANTVLFDGIQLFKEEFGSSYTYDENGNVTSVKDLQGQITSYEYENNNLTEVILSTGAKQTYTYDSYHNVKTATTEEGVLYTFDYDVYGNNTAVSIQYGDSSITSTAAYTSDGNRLVSTTDALGKTTTYSYNADTNLLEWSQAPEDTESTRTNFTYDSMYRLATVSAKVTGSTESTLSVTYGYTDDLLTSIQTNSTAFTMSYGDFALRSSIMAGSHTLANYSYTDRDNYLSALDYDNGDMVKYSYDEYGRLVAQLYEDGESVTYKFDNDGNLATMVDTATGISTKYYYDFTNRLTKFVETGTDHSHSIAYTYDNLNNLTQRKQITNGDVFTTNYTYDDDNRPATVVNGNTSKAYTYDSYGRLSQQSTSVSGSPILTETFSYYTGTGGTSGQLRQYASTYGDGSLSYTYTYDDNGNIATVSDGTNTTRYVYDSQNQLIREYNQAAGKIWSWKYDDAGNLTYHREYEYSDTNMTTPLYTMRYTYGDEDGWGDLLTAYNGVAITYDGIGNPLSDGTWTYTWEHGRQMASMSDGTTTWDMTYNADGLRTGRTNGTNTYTYWYNESGQLVRLKFNSLVMRIAYGASGQPISISYNGNTYYYVLNQQGDVMALLDSSGNWVVKYTYDAWGNILTTTASTETMRLTLAKYNPLRYRGYVYDRETGLYYLQSRYYNPKIGRFINADGLVSTGQGLLGNNMFAYCGNNPVNRKDSTGQFWFAAVIVTAIVAICSVGLSGCSPQPKSRPRSDLANAPDLDVHSASPESYNCYGNGIGKQIIANPTGYIKGDSTRKTFEAVKKDLGSDNVRELTSYSDSVYSDEFKVAIKCGPTDYHFIRLDGNNWYNKSGTMPGTYIDPHLVDSDVWYAIWEAGNRIYIGDPQFGFPYYDDETIYFAVKVGWDK